MHATLWSQSYIVNSFLVNPQKKLGLYGLLNLIQDTAWIHATHLGHGYEKMLSQGSAWVLARQKLVMDKWPGWGDEVLIKTWIRPIKGVIAVRDFEIWSKDQKIGACTSQWLIMDLKSRRPSEKGEETFDGQWRLDAPEELNAKKISLSTGAIALCEFAVRNSDLDLNGHVNNTRYAQWILDSIPPEKHTEHTLEDFEINFIAETKSNDTIQILCVQLAADTFQFQGLRLSDQKIVFLANVKVSAEQLSL